MTAEEQRAAAIALRESWPPEEWNEVGGWRLRAMSGGYARVNSVWSGTFSGLIDLPLAIDRVEEFYAARGLPPRFQLIDGTEPTGLDAALANRGYIVESRSLMMAKEVTPAAAPENVTSSENPTDAWLRLYLSGQDAVRAEECPKVLACLPTSRAFFSNAADAESGTVAMCAQSAGVAVVECVYTSPDRRRIGGATAVVRAAEAWAYSVGARRIVLAVVSGNRTAEHLYADLGYRPVGSYHYRLKRG